MDYYTILERWRKAEPPSGKIKLPETGEFKYSFEAKEAFEKLQKYASKELDKMFKKNAALKKRYNDLMKIMKKNDGES